MLIFYFKGDVKISPIIAACAQVFKAKLSEFVSFESNLDEDGCYQYIYSHYEKGEFRTRFEIYCETPHRFGETNIEQQITIAIELNKILHQTIAVNAPETQYPYCYILVETNEIFIANEWISHDHDDDIFGISLDYNTKSIVNLQHR